MNIILKSGLPGSDKSTLAEEEAKNVWRELAQKYSAKLIIIECVTSDTGLHKQRIDARVRNLHGIPEITWQRVQNRKVAYTSWKEQALRVDAVNPLESNVKIAVEYIQEKSV